VALTGPSLCVTHERSSGPSLTCGSVVRPAQAVLRPPPTPTRHQPTSRPTPVIGPVTPTARSAGLPGRGGPPQFPPPPSERSTPSTPRSSSGLRFQDLHPFHGLRPTGRGSALPDTRSRRGRLRLTLRTARSHTPEGCLTLRFDPGRFPPKPAACYRASWQLPGPDPPRQATTSLCWIRSTHCTTSNAGRTPVRRGASWWRSGWCDG
jgi:hypothetical protein